MKTAKISKEMRPDLKYAFKCLEEARFSTAQVLLSDALSKDPGNRSVAYVIGLAYLKAKNVRKAYEILSRLADERARRVAKRIEDSGILAFAPRAPQQEITEEQIAGIKRFKINDGFRKRLRAVLYEKGCAQQEIANALGVKPPTFSSYMHGALAILCSDEEKIYAELRRRGATDNDVVELRKLAGIAKKEYLADRC